MGKIRKILLLTLVHIILFSSCRTKDNIDKLIPEKDLVDVLAELYVGDGLLIFPPVRNKFSVKDSILNHIDIITSHGFTKEQMDKTLRYYFEKNPKKLENIYDQVLTKLNEMQVLVDKELTFRNQNPSNLWKKSVFIDVPGTGEDNQVWFNIPVKDTGNYILEFMSTVYLDDKSLNPRVTVFFWHSDSSKKENRIDWNEIVLPKDGKSHSYILSKRFTDSTFKYIGGWLLKSDSGKNRLEKHAKIENIIVRNANAK
jgi:hypothetical protein